ARIGSELDPELCLSCGEQLLDPLQRNVHCCRNLSLAHFVVGLQDHSQTHPWRKTVDRFANRRIRLSGNQSHILRDRHRGRMGSEALLTAPDNGAVPKMTDGAIPRGSEEVP